MSPLTCRMLAMVVAFTVLSQRGTDSDFLQRQWFFASRHVEGRQTARFDRGVTRSDD